MKCTRCNAPIKDFVDYGDKICFYWCKCSIGSLIYRKEKDEKEKTSKPVSGKRRKASNIKGSRTDRKGKSKVQSRNRVKSKSTAAAGWS
jgi:hypothetical protein